MEQPNLPTPHNNFFHFALSNLTAARSLVESHLPPRVLKELKLDTLRLETASFVDSHLREKYSDLLLSAELAGATVDGPKEALVYLLLEHKSESDLLTVLQLLSYIVRIWEQRARDGLPLCPIVPLVVYHGEKAWSAARDMDQLVSAPDALRAYQVRFGFPLLDLSQLSDDEIRGAGVLQSSLRLLNMGEAASCRRSWQRYSGC